jgi:hypothetical protein
LIDGFSVIRSPRPLLRASFWSLEIWLVASLLAWLTMFSLDIRLPFAAGVLVQVAAALAVTVAASPGQVGVFHLIAVSVLKLYLVDPNQALAFAFVLHGLTYVLLMLLGIGSMWREGLDWSKIQNITAQKPPEQGDKAPEEAARTSTPPGGNGAYPDPADAEGPLDRTVERMDLERRD